MEIISKSIGKIRRGILFVWEFVVLKNIYEITYRLNFPKLSALILFLLTKELNDKREYRVLCLGRSIFHSDVMALVKYGKNIQYLYFHKLLLGKIVRHFIPKFNVEHREFKEIDISLIPGYKESNKRENIGIEHGTTYHVDPSYKEGKDKIYKYMLKMMPILKKLLKFDAVMSGNYIYVDQQEFIKICEKNDIPGIILYKEGLPHYWFDNLYAPGNTACKFIGSRILFVNEYSKKHELKYLPGLEEKHSITVGIPRYDHYINDKISVNKKQIVFFAFALIEHLRRWDDLELTKAKEIRKISEQFVRNIIEFSINNKEYTVFIKLKGVAPRYRELIDIVLDKHFNGKKIPNLIITSRQSSERLVMSSEVIISYNCGILFESVLCKKPIICPDFMDLSYGDYFDDHPELVNYTNDYNKIEEIIFNHESFKYKNLEKRKDFLEKSMHAMDGKASMRAEKAIIDTIEERRKKVAVYYN